MLGWAWEGSPGLLEAGGQGSGEGWVIHGIVHIWGSCEEGAGSRGALGMEKGLCCRRAVVPLFAVDVFVGLLHVLFLFEVFAEGVG